jgi:anion-transporting  ArsA/GET3 family ATPase
LQANEAKQGSSWQRRPIVFVSGKGGVGKSLIAAGLAKELAEAGNRVLLAELGETSYYRDFWNLSAVGHNPTPHKDGFDIALWSGETSLHEYVLHYLKLERLVNLFFENRVMKALVNVAPGLAEIAIVGKITSGLRKVGPPLRYDIIVVDCYATGHAEALFLAPKGMKEAIGVGPMGHHSREMDALLRNESVCSYVVTTLLEELPVTETLEFAKTLKSKLGVGCEIVANKVIRMPIPTADMARLNQSDAGHLHQFTDYLVGVEKRQSRYLETLAKVGNSLSIVPMIFDANPEILVLKTGEALRAQ